MADPNLWQDDPDAFARSIAEEARRQSEAAIGKGGEDKGGKRADKRASRQSMPELSELSRSPQRSPQSSDRPSPLPNTLDDLPRRQQPSEPDALARLIAERARRQSESFIGDSNGAGDRLLLYLILTPGVGMAISPWMLVRSRSTPRQRQASRFALVVGAIWLVMTLLSASGGGDVSPWTSLGSASTWIYVFLMLSQMVRVWQRKSLPIKR
ncbi:MAG: hypothetical protein AAF889_10530 [Cyanobacteria bacterium P01_D01_bin.73]